MTKFNEGDAVVITGGLSSFIGLTGTVLRGPNPHRNEVFIRPDSIRKDTGDRSNFYWPADKVEIVPKGLGPLRREVQRLRDLGYVVSVKVTEPPVQQKTVRL